MNLQQGDIQRKSLLYMQIAEKVKEEIRIRNLAPHDPVPSEGELAQMFGVSRMTSKLALEALTKQGIVYRLPRRGTFLAGDYAKQDHESIHSLANEKQAKPKKKRIALVVPNLDDYISRIIQSTEAAAREHHYHLLVRITKDKEDESSSLQELYEDHMDGIILYPRGRKTCSEMVMKLRLLGYPLVIIDRIFREVEIDCVYHDHFQGAYRLTEYLIAMGHKEIGFISMPFDGVTSREDRYKGFLQAMLDHKLPLNSYNFFLNCSEMMNDLNAANPQLEDFIQGNAALTAIMCMDDYLAASCLSTAIHMKKKVPDQLSIAGFSDILLASLLPVPLTTVRQPTGPLGQAAVELLDKRLTAPEGKAVTVKVDTLLIKRDTVKRLHS
ncbi:substrate-binding domain-containing protein [Paenibacillus hamazuiensis]|uniref:GntR family transcriptional regulator n=1 Tax=Paenibacillus hamazuiensis TaxID=2936508 RepID=UPI00200ED51A|nr:GntR family transcriptional regulator [Paenibacillus hamazuiensis]